MHNKLVVLIFLLVAKSSFSQTLIKAINPNSFVMKSNNKYGIIDSIGNIVIPISCDFIEFENGRVIVKKNKLHALYSLDNKEIVGAKFKYILPRKNGRFLIWTPNDIKGLIDSNGKTIIPVKYRDISSTDLDDYYFTINVSKLCGVYNFEGENIIPEQFQFFTIDNYKIFAVKDGQPLILDVLNPKQIVSLDNQITLIPTIRHYSSSEKFYQIVEKENKYGLINANNEYVIPLNYDGLTSSEDWRYFIVKSKNKIGIIDVAGNIIRQPIYDNIEFHKEYVTLIKKNKKNEFYSYGSK